MPTGGRRAPLLVHRVAIRRSGRRHRGTDRQAGGHLEPVDDLGIAAPARCHAAGHWLWPPAGRPRGVSYRGLKAIPGSAWKSPTNGEWPWTDLREQEPRDVMMAVAATTALHPSMPL